MTETTGYTSLIQFQPDATRREAANVGVVLYCPGRFLEIKIGSEVGHAKKLFGDKQDAEFLADMKRAR